MSDPKARIPNIGHFPVVGIAAAANDDGANAADGGGIDGSRSAIMVASTTSRKTAADNITDFHVDDNYVIENAFVCPTRRSPPCLTWFGHSLSRGVVLKGRFAGFVGRSSSPA
jgi:hypothetical protein